MPTTLTAVDFTHGAWFIQARTNSGGTAVDDASGEDFRIPAAQYATGGAVTPLAYRSVLTSGMSFNVGSGTAKKDVVVVPGTSSGSPYPYLATLNAATVTVTLPASSPSGLRRDELYVVVPDPAYPTATVALPRLIVRQGDLGGALPGPDAGWRAYVKIGQYLVNQNATAPIIEVGGTGAPAATLQPQIMPVHAPDHAITERDSLGVYFPRVDRVLVPIADFGPGTTLTPTLVSSATKTIDLPSDYGNQNIRVHATARGTYNQFGTVSEALAPRGQQVRMQCVINGNTTGKVQVDSTNIWGTTDVILTAGHMLDLSGASAFTVAVRGAHGISNGGGFTTCEIDLTVVYPRPEGANHLTVT